MIWLSSRFCFKKFGNFNGNINKKPSNLKSNSNNINIKEEKLNENEDPWFNSRILIGLNNQKDFEIHELEIKNLDLNDIKLFQKEMNEMKNYAHGDNHQYIKLENLTKNKIP